MVRTVLLLAGERLDVTDPDASAGRRRFLSAAGVGPGAALGDCSSVTGGGDDDTDTPRGTPEATVTVRPRNHDDAEREYEVAVRQVDDLTDSFTSVLPTNRERWVEIGATFGPADERHEVTMTVGEPARDHVGPDRLGRLPRRGDGRERRPGVRGAASKRVKPDSRRRTATY
ncbi:hypothetical protein BRD03_00100 [Halobacteriales archaeon QS_9_68_17]|nr:MAG: hypothetical protein BRD03_00100 [Halobacteriales archaeon QS_9_68_17]